jgi:hypothetical protein
LFLHGGGSPAIVYGDSGNFRLGKESSPGGSFTEQFRVTTDGEVHLSGAADSKTELRLSNTADVVLTLEADKDNVTESHNCWIDFIQDQRLIRGQAGLCGGNNVLPDGTSAVGTVGNYFFFGSVEGSSGLHLATKATSSLDININQIVSMPLHPYLSVEKTNTDALSTGAVDLFQSSTIITHASNRITFSTTNGRATIPAGGDGIYVIVCTVILLGDSSPSTATLQVRVDGSTVWNASIAVHGSVDPVERTIHVIRPLTATDYIEIFYDATAGSVAGQPGSTLTIWKIA